MLRGRKKAFRPGDVVLSLFDIDDLDLIMPVDRNVLKIQWDGTKISVVWKIVWSMCFIFVIYFVLKFIHDIFLYRIYALNVCIKVTY